ncbi:MAG: SIR2 family protein [Lachnospiraceae bacterium]|nr:SIR2 family protein [Lachnospiraceae bacterium]
MELSEAIEKKKLVVVAGAGISKDTPANLPSWWDYNQLLIEMIGKLGAEEIGESENLLDVEKAVRTIPVTSISEFFVNRIAGKSYFPLLSLLDGVQPNIHHNMLADLAEKGILKAIITTNFDTLIEKAFINKGILAHSFTMSSEFTVDSLQDDFPIFKIHGSADNPLYAIDTVSQKMQGLSEEKRYILKTLFAENHILFMGFSGEDYLFGSDYIPIQSNKKNGYGITWIAHPGSTFNDITIGLIKELNIKVIQKKLPEFYTSMGWEMREETFSGLKIENNFRENAENKIRELLESKAIGKKACLGMCIELCEIMGDSQKSESIVSRIKPFLKKWKNENPLYMFQSLSLYSELALFAQLRDRKEDALEYCEEQLTFLDSYETFLKQSGKRGDELDPAFRERAVNRSTILNRKGSIIVTYEDRIDEAYEYYSRSFYCAYLGRHYMNMAVTLSNMASIKFRKKEFDPIKPLHYLAMTECARRIGEHGGCAEELYSINFALVRMYFFLGQKKLMEDSIKKMKQLIPLCLNKKKYELMLKELEDDVKACREEEPLPNGHMNFVLPYDVPNLWDPYGQRAILSCKEGRKAKEMYDLGECTHSLQYLLDIGGKLSADGQFEKAEMFFDCAAGMFSERANKCEDMAQYMRALYDARICYGNCLILQFKSGRFDYLAGTLGSLSKLNYVLSENKEQLELAIYQAELALCMCEDPTECWQAIMAAEVATRLNFRLGNTIAAQIYGEKYLKMVKKAPWGAEDANVEQITQILKQISNQEHFMKGKDGIIVER